MREVAQEPRADGRTNPMAASPWLTPRLMRMRSIRRSIFCAARREKVRSSMWPVWAPCSIRWTTRWASVWGLPEPAFAIIDKGPHEPDYSAP